MQEAEEIAGHAVTLSLNTNMKPGHVDRSIREGISFFRER